MKRDHARQVRRDRVILGGLGVLVAAVAIVLTLLHTGALDRLGDLRSEGRVLGPELRAHFERNELTWQLIVFGVGLALVALGVWWLRGQIPPLPEHQDVELEVPSEVPGETTVSGRALARALEDDLRRNDGVADARAQVRAADGRLRLGLDVPTDVDLDHVLDEVVPAAVDRFAMVSDLPSPPEVEIELRLVAPVGRTVH